MSDGEALAANDALQRQAKALGDPSRLSIFRFIAGSPQPVDIAALTLHVQLNHNAVRQHLAKLVDAGLVQESRARVAAADGRTCCTSFIPWPRDVGRTRIPTSD